MMEKNYKFTFCNYKKKNGKEIKVFSKKPLLNDTSLSNTSLHYSQLLTIKHHLKNHPTGEPISEHKSLPVQ